MNSTSTRLKERGGAGGKIMAVKPSKTLNPKSPPEKLRSISVHKSAPVSIPLSPPEKLRSSSVRKSAPVSNPKSPPEKLRANSIRKSAPVPNPSVRSVSAGRRRDPTPNRVEKPVMTSGSGVRKSTSSVPRSRGPVNPSDFSRFVRGEIRVLGRNGGKEGESEAAGLRRSGSGIRVLGNEGLRGNGGKNLGFGAGRVLEKCNLKLVKKSEKIVPALEKCDLRQGKKETLRDIAKVNGEMCKNTNGNCVNSTSIETKTEIEADLNKAVAVSLPTFTVKWNYTNTSNSDEIAEKEATKAEEVKVLDKVKIFEKKIDDSANSRDQMANNYPSKLHEKLALLEGRVQKIASEIKRTKEILDDSNPDESKLILSEIQNKISSVEKAVGKTLVCTTDKTLNPKPTLNPNFSSKGLNSQELESRFFPHQKLMQSNKSKTLNPIQIDEKSIEVEFLASLSGTKTGTGAGSSAQNPVPVQSGSSSESGIDLRADETIQDLDSQESKAGILVPNETDEKSGTELSQIGTKNATGGWFVSEGEAVLLAQSDGSCLYYDIVNCEEKSIYKPPKLVPQNCFTDCWLVRAAGTDGCSGRYVVAASSGPTLNPGFCTWDFHSRSATSFLLEDSLQNPKPCWFRPCGPLLVRTASWQNRVSVFDIRDGETVLKWEVENSVGEMEGSSPVQWRSRGKMVICGEERVSLWDVNSVKAESLMSFGGDKRVLAMHVCNTDEEIGGGVRQRVSSSEAEGNDGVFSTQDSINVIDFRVPTGTGTRISRTSQGSVPVSVFSRGDSVFVGTKSRVEHFSVRKGKLMSSYELESSDSRTGTVSQVWGSTGTGTVMGVCDKGLFVFDMLKEGFTGTGTIRERIGTDGVLKSPSFDYCGSRVLLVSKDRPAMWRYL